MSDQKTPFKMELCTDDAAEAVAKSDRVDQIEFCAELNQDGLTPAFESVRHLVGRLKIPLKIMIRHRGGNFLFDRKDLSILVQQAAQFKELGISRFVFGAIKPGRLDFGLIEEFCKSVFPATVCIHKAIDQSDRILLDLQQLYSIPNVNEVLTSGGQPTALEGASMIRKMIELTHQSNSTQPEGRRIDIIAAGKITNQNLNECHTRINAPTYHGRLIVE